ncbi:MAG: hypothetical protein ACFFAN_04655 [Promethearchaeota archaeon]
MVTKEEIDMFLFETEGHIQKCKEEIRKFEDNPKDKKSLEELYFSFQALKALAPMVGFNNLSKYCFYFESLLKNAKDTKATTKKADDLVNLILDCLDILDSVLNNVKNGNLEDIKDELLNNQKVLLNNYESEYEITFINPIPLEEIKTVISDSKNKKFYKIYIRIPETCKFKKVRLYFIFRALSKIGHICWSDPQPMMLESLDSEEFEFEFEFDIYFISHEGIVQEEITQVLDEILEIEKKVITEIKPKKFEQILTNLTIKHQKEKEKMANLQKSYEELEKEYEINYIFPITLEEINSIESDKSNIFYHIYIRIELSCKNKKARLYFILKALNEIGHICWSNPNPEKLEKGTINLDFELYFISKFKRDEIIQELSKISEINRKSVKEISSKSFKGIIAKFSLDYQKKSRKPKEKIGVPKIIFTEKIDNMQKILLPNEQLFEMIINEKLNLIFSCYKSLDSTQFNMYIVKEGVCFVTENDDFSKFENLYNIDKKGFTNFDEFLDSSRYGINNFLEYKEFKESKFYSPNVDSYKNYIAAKKN